MANFGLLMETTTPAIFRKDCFKALDALQSSIKESIQETSPKAASTASENLNTLMVRSMKATGKIAKCTAKES
jgi:hypothetical protein